MRPFAGAKGPICFESCRISFRNAYGTDETAVIFAYTGIPLKLLIKMGIVLETLSLFPFFVFSR